MSYQVHYHLHISITISFFIFPFQMCIFDHSTKASKGKTHPQVFGTWHVWLSPPFCTYFASQCIYDIPTRYTINFRSIHGINEFLKRSVAITPNRIKIIWFLNHLLCLFIKRSCVLSFDLTAVEHLYRFFVLPKIPKAPFLSLHYSLVLEYYFHSSSLNSFNVLGNVFW